MSSRISTLESGISQSLRTPPAVPKALFPALPQRLSNSSADVGLADRSRTPPSGAPTRSEGQTSDGNSRESPPVCGDPVPGIRRHRSRSRCVGGLAGGQCTATTIFRRQAGLRKALSARDLRSARTPRCACKVTREAGSKAGALNRGSLLRASRSFLHVVHELLESSAYLSGGGRLGLNAGIVNVLRYRRSPL
jgi:hypothetical protein